MKTTTTKITGISKKELQECIEHFEKMGKTYYWSTPSSASARRYEEKKNSKKWEFKINGIDVVADVDVRCSCKNYYVHRTLKLGDEYKKMMVPFLKKCLSQI